MTSPWTAGQVASVASDTASLVAARKLVASWTLTGCNGVALWGLCQGSGSKPYQAVVDLTGPAYKCSCPSRKFPCKHALGLLVEWSEGRVPDAADPIDFASQWLLSRQEKPERATERAVALTKPASDSATAQKRAERVASGLVELDLWITDQIRGGLASMDTSWTSFDAIAGRMVDAQVPGAATALRALAAVVASTENWPQRVLDEFSRLHLLIVAHQRLDELPGSLQDSVRSHLGYPVSTDSVMESAPVRERWMVLSSSTSEDNRLFTRIVWLLGRNTGRWAQLLDFSHGSANFSGTTPPVGFLIDAELHFYPGAAPLRARMGTTFGEPEPFTTMPVGGIDTALQNYTDALAADPWLRSWPAVIGAVVPSVDSGNWFFVDGEGAAIAAAGDPEVMWTLSAVSGGHPVTVCGTWNAVAYTPVSVFTGGRVIML
ncbi:hypothetical protein ABH922_004192 [Rhodococcus sp. 27YEA15]|uniref:SWIM zinc finger family protein n=1 Tax=Rhodococcus sp. 27YEA15 TaxID=3156259 RepID=UPI003C7E91C5